MGLVSRLGFRGRLIAAMISLVALVSLVIIALLMVYLFEDEKSRALEQLAIGERLTNEVIDRRTDLELSRLSVVVQDFGFRSAIASRDPATIDSALENHSGRVGADFALLLDSQGEPLASTLQNPFPAVSQEQLTSTRRNGFTRSLRAIDGRGYEILIIPIEAPGLRASLVSGFAMDQSLAEVIARLSGTSVIFRARSNQNDNLNSFAATSSIDAKLEQELAGASANANFIETIATPVAAYAQGQSLGATMDVFVFPAEGQDTAQQSKDEAACYEWAVGNTGTDPFDLVKQEQADEQQAQAEQQAAQQAGTGSGARGARCPRCGLSVWQDGHR